MGHVHVCTDLCTYVLIDQGMYLYRGIYYDMSHMPDVYHVPHMYRMSDSPRYVGLQIPLPGMPGPLDHRPWERVTLGSLARIGHPPRTEVPRLRHPLLR